MRTKADPADPLQRYYTPDWVVSHAIKYLLPVICKDDPHWIIDPCCGDGAFAEQLAKAYPEAVVTTNDKDPCVAADTHDDWLDSNASDVKCQYDLLMTNPPFKYALEFADKGLRVAKTVVLLVEMRFLASKKRYEFFEAYNSQPTHVAVIPSRPSFRPDGKVGATDYCFVCWSKNESESAATSLLWLPPKQEREKRCRA